MSINFDRVSCNLTHPVDFQVSINLTTFFREVSGLNQLSFPYTLLYVLEWWQCPAFGTVCILHLFTSVAASVKDHQDNCW